MTEAQIEAAARAMEPRSFAIFDRGYTSKNYFAERAFLNAEKVVKRARKKARLALTAAAEVELAEMQRSMAGFTDEDVAEMEAANR